MKKYTTLLLFIVILSACVPDENTGNKSSEGYKLESNTTILEESLGKVNSNIINGINHNGDKAVTWGNDNYYITPDNLKTKYISFLLRFGDGDDDFLTIIGPTDTKSAEVSDLQYLNFSEPSVYYQDAAARLSFKGGEINKLFMFVGYM